MKRFFPLIAGVLCLLVLQTCADARVDAQFIIRDENGRQIYMLTPEDEIIYGNVLIGQTITFDASSSHSMFPVDEFRWDFNGDGVNDLITNKSIINYTFQNAGIYNTTLFAMATTAPPYGDGDTLTRPIKVVKKLAPPVASFTVRPLAIVNNSASFIFNASESFSLDSYVQYYSWDFDGNERYDWSDKIGTFTARYTKNGYFVATLTVTDYDGLNDTTERVVRIDAFEGVLAELNGTVTIKNRCENDVPIRIMFNNNQVFNITVAKQETLHVPVSQDLNEVYVTSEGKKGLFFFEGNRGITIEITSNSISKTSKSIPGFEFLAIAVGLIFVMVARRRGAHLKKTG